MQGFPESIKQDIDAIVQVASDLKMKAYVVGGFPRDLVSGKGVTPQTDLDITEENGNAFDLAFFVAAKNKINLPTVYESSGTAMLTMPSGRVVEFHNAYHNVPHILDQLYKIGVEPTSINKDVYSRDFTINTLLYDPVSNKILDITKNGVNDINKKILNTPIDPMKTLGLDPKRILRGIRFKIEMGLKPTEEYLAAEKHYAPTLANFLIQKPNSKMVRDTIDKIFKANKDIGYKEFQRLGLLPYIPRVEGMDEMAISNIFGSTLKWYKKSQLVAEEPLVKKPDIFNQNESQKDFNVKDEEENTDNIEDEDILSVEDVLPSQNNDPVLEQEVVKEQISEEVKNKDIGMLKSENFKKWFSGSSAIDDDDEPLVLYHGTTHDFDSFDIEKTYNENYFGKGFYFTDNPYDASKNYATSQGGDIKNRIGNEQEKIKNILSDMEDGDPRLAEFNLSISEDEANFIDNSTGEIIDVYEFSERKAKEKVLGPHEGAIMPVYLRTLKPFRVGKYYDDDMEFELVNDKNGEIIEDENGKPILKGSGAKFIKNLISKIEDLESRFFNSMDVISQIYEMAYERNSIFDFIKKLGKIDKLNYIEDPNTGESISLKNLIADAVFSSGYDSIVMDVGSSSFGDPRGALMSGVGEATHYIVRNPRQIKSSIGNFEFNPRKKSILKKDESEIMAKDNKEIIPGGLSSGKPDSKFDKDQIEKGIKSEFEHTDNKQLAKEIAKDHLTEDPKYYDHLKKMENEYIKKESSNSWYKESKIKKLPNGKYRVVKKDGTGNLGTCDSEDEAKKRLREVEYFKHKNAQKTPIPKADETSDPTSNKMINRILDDREKHRAYMRRKRMEDRRRNLKTKDLFDNIDSAGDTSVNLSKFVDDKKVEKMNRMNKAVEKGY